MPRNPRFSIVNFYKTGKVVVRDRNVPRGYQLYARRVTGKQQYGLKTFKILGRNK